MILGALAGFFFTASVAQGATVDCRALLVPESPANARSRVTVAASFVDVLGQNLAAHTLESGNATFFGSLLTLAEHTPGAAGDTLFARLRDHAQSRLNTKEGRDEMRDIVLALHRAGRNEESQRLLNLLLTTLEADPADPDRYGDTADGVIFDHAVKIFADLEVLGQAAQAPRVLILLNDRYERMVSGFPMSVLEHLRTMTGVTFGAEVYGAIAQRLEPLCRLRFVTTDEIRQLLRELAVRGPIATGDQRAMENLTEHLEGRDHILFFEEDALKVLMKRSVSAKDIGVAAESAAMPPEARQAGRALVTRLVRGSLDAARRKFFVDVLEAYRRNHRDEPYDPHADPVPLLESMVDPERQWDPRYDVAKKSTDDLWDIVRTPGHAKDYMDFILDHPMAHSVLPSLLWAVKEGGIQLSKEEALAVFKRWDVRLTETLRQLAASGYVNRAFPMASHILARDSEHTGLGSPPFPRDLNGNSVYTEHRLAQAKLLMMHGDDPDIAAQARSIMTGLSEEPGRVHFFDEFMPLMTSLFGKFEGGSFHVTAHYAPLMDSAWHYAQMAAVDSAQGAVWARRAHGLLMAHLDGVTAADLGRYTKAYFERATTASAATLQALLDAGLPEEAGGLFQLMARKITEFEAAILAENQKERAQGGVAIVSDALEDHDTANLRFYRQHMDIIFASRIAMLRGQNVDSFLEAVVRDVQSRRHRFDPRSVIMAAGAMAANPRYIEQGRRLFDLAADKLSLIRGDRQDFGKASAYFFDLLEKSPLAEEAKDTLVFRLANMSEPQAGDDWYQLNTSIEEFLKITDRIQEGERRYPRANAEVLRILSSLSHHLSFESNDFYAKAKLAMAASIFNRMVRGHAYVMDGNYAEAVLVLSDDPSHLRRVRTLFPGFLDSRSQRIPRTSAGAIDLSAVRAELYNRKATYRAVRRELAALAGSRAVTPALTHLLDVVGEMLGHEIAERRNALALQHRSSGEAKGDAPRPSAADVSAMRGARILLSLLEDAISSATVRMTPVQQRILETLVSSSGKEEALDKLDMVRSLLQRENMPLRALEILLYAMERADYISPFVMDQYRSRVRSAPVAEKQWFFSVLRRLSADPNQPRNFSDSHLAYFLSPDPLREAYWQQYWSWRNAGYLGTRDEARHPFLGSFDSRNLRMAALYGISRWSGHGLSAAGNVRKFLRMLYVDRMYDPSAPRGLNYRVTVDQIQSNLRELGSDVVFTAEERAVIEAQLLTERVRLDPIGFATQLPQRPFWGNLGRDGASLFTAVPRLAELPERIYRPLAKFASTNALEYGDDKFLNAFSIMFGQHNLTGAEKTQLITDLDAIVLETNDKMAVIGRTPDGKLPQAFKSQPEVVRFILAQYFRQLPFGEREAILREFDGNGASSGLSGPAALRRFFELTSTEKIGQFLSTRSDLVPEDYRRELQSFQENVAGSSWDEVRSTIETELGHPLTTLFSRVEERPLNVGTIGEVYRAWRPDGTAVVVKVITPSRRRAMKTMLERLKSVSQVLQRESRRFALHFDADTLYAEFRRTLESELDFRSEIVNADAMAATLTEGFSIPPFLRDLSSPSVLVQTFADGVNPLRVTSEEMRRSVVNRLGQLLMGQILNHGLFHEDLHPGNFRVVEATGAVQLLDFGRVGHLSATERQALVPLLLALNLKQGEQVVALLDSVKASNRSYDRPLLTERVSAILQGPSAGVNGDTISRIFFEAGSAGLAIPSGYIQLLKGLMTFEGTAHLMGGEMPHGF